jgi:hypothetical protein
MKTPNPRKLRNLRIPENSENSENSEIKDPWPAIPDNIVAFATAIK